MRGAMPPPFINQRKKGTAIVNPSGSAIEVPGWEKRSMRIDDTITIREEELSFEFIRSGGPGGQNVNKVATAAQLRFNLAESQSLPEAVRQRLLQTLARRLNRNGEVVITASRHRTQHQNRSDALQRLAEMIRSAAIPPRQRRTTRPTRASRERARRAKQHRSKIKHWRKAVRSRDRF
jgi:ribosome-associated protein